MAIQKTNQQQRRASSSTLLSILLAIFLLSSQVDGGWYHAMANAMGWNEGWESKGVTFGLKSKGMTAIIPIPLPIPIFSKDKKGDSGGTKDTGDDGGGDMKGGGMMPGGWDMPPTGDWW